MKLTNLDEKMSIRIDAETKDSLIAYGYTLGFEGTYSDTIRHVLRTHLPELVKRLPEDKQKEYNKTYEYLQTERSLKEMVITGETAPDHTLKENGNE